MSDHQSGSNETTTNPRTTTTDTRTDGAWHVTLPERVGNKIEQRIVGTDFDSVEEYVTFALESLLRELDEQEDEDLQYGTSRDVDSEDVEAIQEHLESLGYL